MSRSSRLYALVATCAILTAPAWLTGCGGSGGGSSNTVALLTTNQGVPQNATWAAFQDGSGAWVQLQATQTGQYRATVTSPDKRYGLVTVTPDGGGGYNVGILNATTTELSQIALDASGNGAGLLNVSGSMTGYNNGDFYYLSAGPDSRIDGPAASTYSTVALPGTRDVLAICYSPGTKVVSRYFVKRNVSISSDYTCNIDFGGGNAIAPVPFNISAINGTGGTLSVDWALATKNGAWVEMNLGNGVSSAVGGVLPSAWRDSGDIYTVMAQAYESVGGIYSSSSRTAAFTSPSDVSLAVPPRLTATVTQATTIPYARARANWTAWPNASAYLLTQWGQNLTWTATATPGWLSGASTYTMPDLTAAPGWQPSWGSALKTDYWSIQAFGGTDPLSDIVTNHYTRRYTPGATVLQSMVTND